MKPSDFKIGQRLWYVPNETRNAPFFVTISRIGRTWLGVEGGYVGSDDRVNIETMVVWSTLPHGVCWAKREEWEAHQAIVSAWEQFRARIGEFSLHRPPDEVTIADIKAARKLLRL